MKLRMIWAIVLCWGWLGGAKAQQPDTLKVRPKVGSFVVPAVLVGYGLISLAEKNGVRNLDLTTRNELQEDHPYFAMHADDYLQFAPAAAVYGLHIAGIRGEHSLADATGLYLMSAAIMGGTVHGMKSLTHRLRPNGSAYNSFPSGHTASAFAAAEFLNQEYKNVSPWYGYAGYTLATATGILRMYNNKHWLSDVVAGAGFGMLSTKISYLLYPKLKRLITGRDQSSFNLVPFYGPESTVGNLSYPGSPPGSGKPDFRSTGQHFGLTLTGRF